MLTEDWASATLGGDGNWRFKEFVCRRFVIPRQRFESVMPLQSRHLSWKRKLAMYAGGRSSLLTWEEHMTYAVRASLYWGVWLSDPRAWSLHSPDHGSVWQQNLPALIQAVEAGKYPTSQIGYYDLNLNDWLAMLEAA